MYQFNGGAFFASAIIGVVAVALLVLAICGIIKLIKTIKWNIDNKKYQRFLTESRYMKDVDKAFKTYSAVKGDPRIVQAKSVNSLDKIRNYDISCHISDIISSPQYRETIQTAEKYNREYPYFQQMIDDVSLTTADEAKQINLPLSKCREFEKRWRTHDCPQPLDDFIIHNVEYTSPAGRNHYETTAYMPFDRFYVFYQLVHPKLASTPPTGGLHGDVYGDNKFISSNKFLQNYQFNRNYDKPGVYIILSYDEPPASAEAKKNYCGVYVGQSKTIYNRVRQHFTGHGNGDVYHDVKAGRYVYVKLVFCEREDLNTLEKYFISYYNATEYYNKTKGGAAL